MASGIIAILQAGPPGVGLGIRTSEMRGGSGAGNLELQQG
jgi:hypothetical protein